MIFDRRLLGALSAVSAAFLFFLTFVVSSTMTSTSSAATRQEPPAPTPPGARLGAAQTFSKAEADAAIRYWTRERMASAKPVNMWSRPDQDGGTARQPALASEAHGFLGGQAPASSRGAPSLAPSEGYWQRSTTAAPARTIGKLFFQTWIPSRGRYENSVCSAAVISAENRSTVWTAGHCVYNTYSNLWNRTYMFCPGYRDNNGVPRETADCPLGKWTAQYQNTTAQWKSSVCNPDGSCTHREFDYDFGALKIYPQGGQSIQSRTGSHVLRYNIQIADHYDFGYPQDPPFTGRYLYVCMATNLMQHGHLRQPCGMTGGASGGPWLSNFNSGWRGYLNSVNSHGGRASGYMDGPFQGRVSQLLYNSMRNL
jgi:V8-like Glu-specific endopeptidase